MASINTYLSQIMSAVYGEEVRGSIHDAIEAINNENINVQVTCDKAKAAAEEAKKAAQSSMESASASESAAEKSAKTAKEAEETVTKLAEDVTKKASDVTNMRDDLKKARDIRDPLLDSKGQEMLDNNGNVIYGRIVLANGSDIFELDKRVDLLEFESKELEKAKRSFIDQTEMLADMRDDLMDATGIRDPLLDSTGNAIFDDLGRNIYGRVVFPKASDVSALTQKLNALESVVNTLIRRVFGLNSHALLDNTFNSI